jgi:hypothetical protein
VLTGTGLISLSVRPKHTDHECAAIPDDEQAQSSTKASVLVNIAISASATKRPDRSLRTIIADCIESRSRPLIVHACAKTLMSIILLPLQPHVLELELIGFVLPYARQLPVSVAAAGPAVARLSPRTAVMTAADPATTRAIRMSIAFPVLS